MAINFSLEPAINKVRPKKKKAFLRYKKFLKWIKFTALIVMILIFVWISFDGYHRLLSRDLIEEATPLLKPLNPNINTDIFDMVKSKKYYKISEVDSYFHQALEIQQETEVLQPEATSSSELNEE